MFTCTLSATGAAVGRVALGIIFSTAGLSKSLSPTLSDSVGSALRALGLTPLFLPTLVAGEILLGIWLISGTYRQAAVWMAAFTLLAFSCTLIVLSQRGYSGDCGCFLGTRKRASRVDIGRNAGFLLVAIVVANLPAPNQCIATRLKTSEFVVWLMAGVLTCFVLCYLAFRVQVQRIFSTRTNNEVTS